MHWRLVRTKTLLRERVEKGFPEEPLLAATQTKGVVRKDQYENRTVMAMKDLHLLKLVKERDFVISLRSFQGGIEFARQQGIISPAYTVLYPIDPGTHGYLSWLFKSKPYLGNLSLHVTGIRQGQNIDYERLSRSEIPLPPSDEQAAIVRFLDHADRKIRKYIRAKKRLIDLLNEQKQAIIHQAVTRGLDPNVKLKASGIEWLGEVPEHWEVLPFVRCCVEQADYRGATPQKHATGIFLVTAKNVRKGWIDYESSKEFVAHSDYARIMRRGFPRTGDILFTTEAPLGNFALIDREDIALAQRVIRFRLDPRLANPQFMLYALLSSYFQWQLEVRATGSTASGIKASKLPQLVVVRPPLLEQDALVAHLDTASSRANSGIHLASRQVVLAQEYRTRLISDVVTGKLDVREAAAALPDELSDTADDEPLEDAGELEEAEADDLEAVAADDDG